MSSDRLDPPAGRVRVDGQVPKGMSLSLDRILSDVGLGGGEALYMV